MKPPNVVPFMASCTEIGNVLVQNADFKKAKIGSGVRGVLAQVAN